MTDLFQEFLEAFQDNPSQNPNLQHLEQLDTKFTSSEQLIQFYKLLKKENQISQSNIYVVSYGLIMLTRQLKILDRNKSAVTQLATSLNEDIQDFFQILLPFENTSIYKLAIYSVSNYLAVVAVRGLSLQLLKDFFIEAVSGIKANNNLIYFIVEKIVRQALMSYDQSELEEVFVQLSQFCVQYLNSVIESQLSIFSPDNSHNFSKTDSFEVQEDLPKDNNLNQCYIDSLKQRAVLDILELLIRGWQLSDEESINVSICSHQVQEVLAHAPNFLINLYSIYPQAYDLLTSLSQIKNIYHFELPASVICGCISRLSRRINTQQHEQHSEEFLLSNVAENLDANQFLQALTLTNIEEFEESVIQLLKQIVNLWQYFKDEDYYVSAPINAFFVFVSKFLTSAMNLSSSQLQQQQSILFCKQKELLRTAKRISLFITNLLLNLQPICCIRNLPELRGCIEMSLWCSDVQQNESIARFLTRLDSILRDTSEQIIASETSDLSETLSKISLDQISTANNQYNSNMILKIILLSVESGLFSNCDVIFQKMVIDRLFQVMTEENDFHGENIELMTLCLKVLSCGSEEFNLSFEQQEYLMDVLQATQQIGSESWELCNRQQCNRIQDYIALSLVVCKNLITTSQEGLIHLLSSQDQKITISNHLYELCVAVLLLQKNFVAVTTQALHWEQNVMFASVTIQVASYPPSGLEIDKEVQYIALRLGEVPFPFSGGINAILECLKYLSWLEIPSKRLSTLLQRCMASAQQAMKTCAQTDIKELTYFEEYFEALKAVGIKLIFGTTLQSMSETAEVSCNTSADFNFLQVFLQHLICVLEIFGINGVKENTFIAPAAINLLADVLQCADESKIRQEVLNCIAQTTLLNWDIISQLLDSCWPCDERLQQSAVEVLQAVSELGDSAGDEAFCSILADIFCQPQMEALYSINKMGIVKAISRSAAPIFILAEGIVQYYAKTNQENDFNKIVELLQERVSQDELLITPPCLREAVIREEVLPVVLKLL